MKKIDMGKHDQADWGSTRYHAGRCTMSTFNSEDERAAWALAESLSDQARTMMRQAEAALETWKLGKEMNRLRCERRGISASDAEIRWRNRPTRRTR